MNNFGRILFFYGLFFSSFSANASEQPPSAYNELESSPYKLVERLPTLGASSLIVPEVDTKLGVWAANRFIFPGAPAGSDVVIATEKINDKPIKVIQLQLRSNLTRTLEFSQILAKPRLVLQFKVPPAQTNNDSAGSIYVGVYIGKRLLDRLRLSSDEEWVRKEYALSTAQFLKQKINLTLSMSCDSEDATLMLFGYFKS